MPWPRGKPQAPLRISKRPPPTIEEWLHFARLAVKVRKCSGLHGASEDNLVKYAAFLTLVGGVSDPVAQEVFGLLNQLLLARGPGMATKGRIQQLGTHLNYLPISPEALQKIAAAVAAAEAIEPVEQATFPVAAFLKVALQVLNPKDYVEMAKKRDLESWTIRTVFCQGTLTWVKARYRGVVGDTGDLAHREQVKGIKTIR